MSESSIYKASSLFSALQRLVVLSAERSVFKRSVSKNKRFVLAGYKEYNFKRKEGML